MLNPQLEQFITRMPKVELHLHLEGTISPRTILMLARRNGISLPANDEAGIADLFRYRDFGEFLSVFMALAQAIVSGDDFAQLAYELGLDLASQQVRYAEVMISPMQYRKRGMDLREVIAGTQAGFARAGRETGLRVGLALDYGRQYGPDDAWAVLEVASACRDIGVVGWSIGGNEIGHPPEPFAPIFAAARAAGLGLMAHAGEVVGPPSVWGAIDHLGATRLGHGIRSIDDPALLATLRERQIVLDVCPSSNLLTGAVSDWASHPLRQLFAAGVPVTINSDDPTFFATTLTDEYRRVVQYLGFSVDDLCATLQTAAAAAFLAPEERHALGQQLTSEIAALRTELGV
ncbi:MAG: adenosine deaminase [Candidatus Viridilinea halotolerans]|uniref:Adenosine deaminase n=1 Tax=Candidatus Viridilinea halotolerans TaxID=2491704 RepID=A0A426U170_9CHLR|nr:MAG: adenosine deaminase [Candidatus Viridilinea halotolerans]